MSQTSERVIFDPDGDVVLLIELDDHETTPPKTPEGSGNENTASLNDLLSNYSPMLGISEDEDEDNSVILPSNASQNESQPTVMNSPTTKAKHQVEMLVSSKHLALSSPVFRNMFANKIAAQDGTVVGERAVIHLEGDDSCALRILLNVIHGLTRRVPKHVDTNMLWRIMILIDKYEFHETAEIFTDMWFAGLRSTLPQHIRDDLGSWIYVCFELGQSEDFETMTKIAILETNCEFEPAQQAQIPYWIIDKMQTFRQGLLNDTLSTLSSFVEKYEGPRRNCCLSSDCDALTLGKLIRGLKSVQLYPVPKPMNFTEPVQNLFSTIRKINLSTSCERNSGPFMFGSSSHVHLDDELKRSLSRIEARFRGLKLEKHPAGKIGGKCVGGQQKFM